MKLKKIGGARRCLCARPQIDVLEPRKLFAAGDLDTTFSFDGRVTTDLFGVENVINDVAVQSNGRIVAVGRHYNEDQTRYDIIVVRYNRDGTLDDTFSPGGSDGDGRLLLDLAGFDDDATSVVIQRDNKIVIGGYADEYVPATDDLIRKGVVLRLLADGSLDPKFFNSNGSPRVKHGIGIEDVTFEDIAVQPDGKIVVAGRTETGEEFARVSRAIVGRYDKNGKADTSFGPEGNGIIINSDGVERADAIALQPDGKIVVAGRGTFDVDDGGDAALLRFTKRGEPDPDFDADGLVVSNPSLTRADGFEDVAILPDGRIVASGFSYKSGLVGLFAPDGGLLQSQFSNAGRLAGYHSIGVQPDGKIIAAGSADNLGSEDFLVTRYNSDLTAQDATFGVNGNVLTNFTEDSNDVIIGLAIQPDGAVVAAGFTFDGSDTDTSDLALARYLGYDDGSAGSISGRIFQDKNGNGKRDDNDTGHAAVRVFIDADKDGKFDASTETSTLTDPNGRYTIPGLLPGSHRVSELVPKGFRRTTPTKSYYNKTIGADQNATLKDFGNTNRGGISGIVFDDLNQNGRRDASDGLLSGFRIFIDLENDGDRDSDDPTVRSDENGEWKIDGLEPGRYFVRIVLQDGYELTTSRRLRIDISGSELVRKVDFGLDQVGPV